MCIGSRLIRRETLILILFWNLRKTVVTAHRCASRETYGERQNIEQEDTATMIVATQCSRQPPSVLAALVSRRAAHSPNARQRPQYRAPLAQACR